MPDHFAALPVQGGRLTATAEPPGPSALWARRSSELTPRSHACHHEHMMSKHYGDHRVQTATPAISLRERPEQALFHIAFSVEIETVSAALGVLKRTALRLVKELRFDRPIEQRSLGIDQVELLLNVEGLAEVQLA